MFKQLTAICFALTLSLPAWTTGAWANVEIQEVKSESGLTAWLLEEHSIPFVALEIRFRGGTSLDDPAKRGANNLMVGLLEEGAGERDARAFATAAEELAAEYQFSVDQDAVEISARFLSENRDESIALLREALTRPRFDPDAIERVRAQVLSGIRSAETDPQQLASNGLSKMVYGDHPYGSPGEGSIETVSALTRDDIITAHAEALTRKRIIISVVGDITAEELSDLLDDLLADLPESGGPELKEAELNLPGGVTVSEFETPQTVAMWVQNGVNRDDPDYFAAYILNHIIGASGFESRLMTEVREKRGLTYGVNTYLIDYDHALVWVGMMSSANDRVSEAVKVVQEEWQRIHDQGVTAKELENAKTYLIGAYPLRFDGNMRIAGIMGAMQTNGLPIDYIETRNARIGAVTLEDVNRVAKERLSPKDLTFYLVGEPQDIANSSQSN